jgi:hypothetical protein
MVTYLYFVIRPTTNLIRKAGDLPPECDLIHDLICPQLFSKKQYDRTGKKKVYDFNQTWPWGGFEGLLGRLRSPGAIGAI